MAGSPRVASYELLLDLAAGGMATVHVARRLGAAGFDRLVVVKRIHRHFAEVEGFRAMFVDEARLSSNVHHVNVVPIVDVVDADGELSLIMDYVESVSLSALLVAAARRGETLALDVASRIVGDALGGLHAAHEATDAEGASLGIVHRDVSPQNVIVGTDGVARVIDFGIAKAAERVTVTKDDAVKGKLRYMAPEQARSEPVDRRSDVFSAGLVLYEAISGRPAIPGTDDASLLISLLSGIVDPIDGVSDPVAAVVTRALDLDPAERYSSAIAFQRALWDAAPPASADGVTATVRMLLGDVIDARREAIRVARREAPAAGARATTPAPSQLVPRLTLGLAAAAVIVSIGVGVLAFRRREPPTAPAAPVAEASSSRLDPPAETSASPAAASVATNGDVDAGGAPKRTRVPSRGRRLHDNPYAPASSR